MSRIFVILCKDFYSLYSNMQRVNALPVGDVFYVANGIIYPPFLSAQDDPVEVSVNHSGAETFKLCNQPAGRVRE